MLKSQNKDFSVARVCVCMGVRLVGRARAPAQACALPWQALPSSIRRYPVWQVQWTRPRAI